MTITIPQTIKERGLSRATSISLYKHQQRMLQMLGGSRWLQQAIEDAYRRSVIVDEQARSGKKSYLTSPGILNSTPAKKATTPRRTK